MKNPVCVHCKYYYVTWDPARPYGCRAMNFKSAQNPALVVLRSSGSRCQMFEEKKKDDGSDSGSSRSGGIVA